MSAGELSSLEALNSSELTYEEVVSFAQNGFDEAEFGRTEFTALRCQRTYYNKIFMHMDKLIDGPMTRYHFKEAAELFKAACTYFKELGYRYVFIYIPEEDIKIFKYATGLGFIPIQELHDQTRVHTFILRKEI